MKNKKRLVARYAGIALVVVAASLLTLFFTVYKGKTAPSVLPAFPGAEGFGTTTVGGRGGQVIHVTNLNDSGAGSLRAALETAGPRIIVFDVSGNIELDSQIIVTNPYVTVAGQTAPGGGITLKAGPNDSSGLLDVRTHDVVVRFMRFRPGAPANVDGENVDGLAIWQENAYNVVFDHNSFSWAVDENASTWDDAHDITFSWNIIAEGLANSTHPQGEHSKGLLVSGARTKDVTVHHNLLAHNEERNPQISTVGAADVVNNVIYNYGDLATQTSPPRGMPVINYLGNYIRPGADSDTARYEFDTFDITNPETGFGQSYGWQFYIRGNIGHHRVSDDVSDAETVSLDGRSYMSSNPFEMSNVTPTSAHRAFADVLAKAGARVQHLDSADQRVIEDARNGTGNIIDDPSEVGGYPTLPSSAAPTDTDQDGMPDSWETSHSLNINSDDSAGDPDDDGYTNIEEYINELVEDVTGASPTSAADTFTRTLTDSWGTADTGGDYSTIGVVGGSYNTTGTEGTITNPTNNAKEARLDEIAVNDTTQLIKLKIDKMATGTNAFAGTFARRTPLGDLYRLYLRFSTGGGIYLQPSAFLSGTDTSIGASDRVDAFDYTPNTYIWLKSEVTGFNPTTIRMKAWLDGQSEPGSWEGTWTNSAPTLQMSGGVGVRMHTPSTFTALPVTFTFDDMSITGDPNSPLPSMPAAIPVPDQPTAPSSNPEGGGSGGGTTTTTKKSTSGGGSYAYAEGGSAENTTGEPAVATTPETETPTENENSNWYEESSNGHGITAVTKPNGGTWLTPAVMIATVGAAVILIGAIGAFAWKHYATKRENGGGTSFPTNYPPY